MKQNDNTAPTATATSTVIFSGGVDSTVLLYDLIAKGYYVEAITFDYGQRHQKEIEYASKTCELLNVPHNTLSLRSLFPIFIGSALTDDAIDIPEGHYTDESQKATVVPNRNSILLNLAMAYSISRKISAVAYGAHANDSTIYPDCRPAFITAIRQLAKTVDYVPLEILAPWENLTKADVVKRGIELKVPFENTWSCYVGKEKACGKCGTCVERLEAFKLAGIEDPIEYEVNEWLKLE